MNGQFNQGTPIAAVSKKPGQIDLFGVANDGRVWTAWYGGTQWNGWSAIGKTLDMFPKNSPLSCLTKQPGQIDLFGIDKNGKVRTLWWNDGIWGNIS